MSTVHGEQHEVFCSFCGLPRARTGPMVGGPGVAICHPCVQRADRMLQDAAGVDLVAGSAEPWLTLTDDELLEALPAIAASGEQVERQLHRWVDVARERGLSWARIGGALAMTRQSAWERFARSPGAGRPASDDAER